MISDKKVGIIGAGKIGEALIRGILKACLVEPDQITASRTSIVSLNKLKDEIGINVTCNNDELLERSDVIILSIKPQIMSQFLDSHSKSFRESHTVISVAAGIKTEFIEKKLDKKIPVIRVMPNTPARVGEAISPYCLGKFATYQDAVIASEIFSAVGVTICVEEKYMDPITAVSGTGPAYIFYVLEALYAASRALGLPDNFSKALVRQTVYGAAKLVVDTGEDPESLREAVTSPRGTTYAAINYLQKNNFYQILMKAVLEACKRAEELGKINDST